jgi:membrane-associated protein
MDFLTTAVEMFLHVDRHLVEFAASYGLWVYALLFLIIFLETGVVVTPFLPGDSLLFATGALAAAGVLDLVTVLSLLSAAAIIGDNMNYAIGRYIGPRVFTESSRLLKREHLLRTQRFYEKHGGKTVVMARFMPIVRTFAPFVAGVGRMNFFRFWMFNIIGGVAWVLICIGSGYLFGNIEFVKKRFELVIVAIVLISILPIAIEWWRARKESAARAAAPAITGVSPRANEPAQRI